MTQILKHVMKCKFSISLYYITLMMNAIIVKMFTEFKNHHFINENDINCAFEINILLIFLFNFLYKNDLQNE